MRDGKERWPALDAIYNWQPREKGFLRLMEWYCMNGRGCQALRNRYRYVVSILEDEIEHSIKLHGEARILSLAAGTCQSVFEAASRFGDKVKIIAIDKDESAFEVSQKLADQFGIRNIEWHLGNALDPGSIAKDFNPTIVEVVGLFDYLEDSVIQGLLRRISRIIAENGTLVTAHIHEHQERLVIEQLLDWVMIYRSKEELRSLLNLGGFGITYSKTEPQNMFTVICGKV